MCESLLHDSELRAGSTSVAGLAVVQAPGGRARPCMHRDLPACLAAARAAARGGLRCLACTRICLLPACLLYCMVTLRFFGWLCAAARAQSRAGEPTYGAY